MADLPALASKVEARRAFAKENSKWGLMPIQRQGAGLALTIISMASLAAVVIALTRGVGGGPTTALLAICTISNAANIFRTNRWVDSQLRAGTSGT